MEQGVAGPAPTQHAEQRQGGLEAPPLALAIPGSRADSHVKALEQWDDECKLDKGSLRKLISVCGGCHGSAEEDATAEGDDLMHDQQRAHEGQPCEHVMQPQLHLLQ